MGKLSKLLEGIEEANQKLDMSKEARMQRAKEQGFDTYDKMYHGSGNIEDFKAFDPKMTGGGADQYGAGFYTTSAPWEASGYAEDGYRGQGKYKAAASGVIPLLTKGRRLLDVDAMESRHLGDALSLDYDQTRNMLSRSSALKRGVDDDDMNPLGDYFESFWGDGAEDWMIDDLAQQYEGRNPEELMSLFDDNSEEYLKALSDVTGFDGLRVNYGDKVHEVHWKPENLRSTNAAFDPAKKDSSNLLASMGAGTLAGAGLMASDDSEASFIGQGAKTFSKGALELAEKMTKEGASRDEIWQATGRMGAPTFKDVDGHWKQEISDKALSVPFTDDRSRKMRELGFTTGEASNFLINKPLTEAYPELKNIDVFVDADRKNSGGYSPAVPDTDDAFGSSAQIDVSPRNNAADRSVLSHELQHAIQHSEGFARGGSSKYFTYKDSVEFDDIDFSKLVPLMEKYNLEGDDLGLNPKKFLESKAIEAKNAGASDEEVKMFNKAYNEAKIKALKEGKKDLSPFDQYKRLAGEAEARNVETRLDYDMDKRIASPPWSTLDVPEDELILRDLGAGLAAASAIPSYKEADETETMATDFVDRRLNRPSRDRRKRREESRKAQALAEAKRNEALEAEAALDEMLRQADMSIDTIRAPVNPAYAAAADYVGKYNRALEGSPAEYLIGLEGVEDYLRKGAYGEADWVDRGMAAVEGAEVLAAPLVGAKAMGKITPQP